MRQPRNPFYIRFSEQAYSDADFLKLFSEGVLDALPINDLWDRINVFRSAPGGGKTSILRLFTPNALLTLHSCKKDEQYKVLYGKMKELGAIQDDGPCVLGALLSCAHGYASLEELDLDNAKKERLLFSLLNVRIILSMLRSALTLKRYKYPNDLDKLHLECPSSIHLPPGFPQVGSGKDYYDWARKIEEDICKTIDGLFPFNKLNFIGHDNLYSLWIVQPECFLCDGIPVAERIVVMLDDVNKLSRYQRTKLLSLITDGRAPTKVWLAERLESLSTKELMSDGAIEGREWNSIYLESYWRNHPKRFESFARIVANKRADTASDGQIGYFAGCLQESPNVTDLHKRLAGSLETVSDRVRKRVAAKNRYKEWLASKDATQGSYSDKLLSWRSFEILIERDLRKLQMTLDLELTNEDLRAQEQSDVRTAAELFLYNEFRFPYYYGFSRLCSMASCNVEQFLSLAGELFEWIISKSLISFYRYPPEISVEKQENILKNVIKQKWKEIVRRVSNPNDVRLLLESIGKFCNSETYQPNAPYSPGVNGIAIKMSDCDLLQNSEYHKKPPDYIRLAKAISTCISYNMLEAKLDHKCKGQRWMVLYLNRMLCVQFDLPLQYGGWREKSLNELSSWLYKGFLPLSEGKFL